MTEQYFTTPEARQDIINKNKEVADKLLTEQLREKIARRIVETLLDDAFEVVELSGSMACEIADLLAPTLLALIKEAGWIDPATIISVEGDDKRIEEIHIRWAKANGYVKLAEDQTRPRPELSLDVHMDYLNAGWRKVEL